MTDWDKRGSEAAETYATGNHCVSFADTADAKAFTAGANWAREELENKKGAMPLELVDRSRQLLKSAHQREIDALRLQCEAMAKENPRAKLTIEQVNEIRRLYIPNCRKYSPGSSKFLANKFGISPSHVLSIVTGVRWRSL